MRAKTMTVIAGGLALVATCSSEQVGEMLVDAGQSLIDAGGTDAVAAIDSTAGNADAVSGGGADAAMPVDVVCNEEYVRTVTYDSGIVAMSTQWYATGTQLAALGTASAPSNAVLLYCDYENLGTSPTACPAGATCTGPSPPVADCSMGLTSFVSGAPQVSCGYKSEVTSPGQPTTTSGYRYRSIKVIPR